MVLLGAWHLIFQLVLVSLSSGVPWSGFPWRESSPQGCLWGFGCSLRFWDRESALANSVIALCSTGRVRIAERERSNHVMGSVSGKSLLCLAYHFTH